MPKLQALNNKGERIEKYKYFTDSEYAAIRRFKKKRWVLVDAGKPKESRKNPVPVGEKKLEGFPEKAPAQHQWVANQEDLEKLKTAHGQATTPGVKRAIEEKIEKLQNK